MLRFRNLFVILALSLLTIAATNTTPEFSATMIADKPISGDHKNVVAKFCVKGDKIREDLFMSRISSTLIIRPDRKTYWVISPASKTYREMKGVPTEIPFYWTLETVKKARGMKQVGQGQYGKYTCDKYRRTIGDKGKSFSATMWVARKLNAVVKMEITPRPKDGPSVMKMINIREQPQSDSLFELPKGYKKVEASGR